ncbi:hypothetical protein GOD90_33320 [Sinorhizobium medicae]|nr:hypothetical protein [Sinorhizobium medicae]MDX0901630.1 hypothetical protein [Sinorhizobium medicae]MDX1177402.1 hypothetical protein [Sinorhizobium medicae]
MHEVASRESSFLGHHFSLRQLLSKVWWDPLFRLARLPGVVSDLEQAVGRADVISAATLSTSAIIKGAWIKSGTHIDLIGGFTPNMREADDVALALSKAYVDTREALHEAGDLVQPIEAGVVSEDHVQGTLADLAKGLIQGRTKAEEITYFKAVGSGLADLAAAKMVYEKIQAGGR